MARERSRHYTGAWAKARAGRAGPAKPRSGWWFSPTARVLLSFVGLILAGTFLLHLPLSAREGQPQIGLVDALFVSTSAVCVTGLTSIDVGMRLSGFGQVVLLCLIQLGGLGFLTLSTGLLLSLGLRSSLLNRVALTETLAGFGAAGLRKLLQVVFVTTFGIELLGAVVLAWRFSRLPELSFPDACWLGLFHSISAFCNAGFSLFSKALGHRGDNLVAFAQDATVSLTVCGLIVLGGLGFLVLDELLAWVRTWSRHRLTLHTKIVLSTSAVLIVGGALGFLILERTNPKTFAGLAWHEMLLPSLFQSVTARTAGYNTVDLGLASGPALLLLIVLMFIGGSPASCAGGIKTTTAFVMFRIAVARLMTRRYPTAFGREISDESATRAATLTLVALAFVAFICGALLLTEAPRLVAKSEGGVFMDLLFEVVSAFGTVGLSTGVTPELTSAAKLFLVLTMYVGRVGPLTLFVTLAQPPREDRIRLPDEPVLVG